ncbi:amino acid permease [Bacillus sp. T17B1]|uniref:amino acid permease n=1 Tax=Bacillus sp. T17B1 TaxID=2918911 RepID=UPI00227E2665|nr:amino acid permease [Bacillus sp. T17B1]
MNFRKKSISTILINSNSGKNSLKQVLGATDLILLGIGCIIGTGIFVLTGIVASEHAGPALVLSFIISGIVCAFAALCYSELASSLPATGSAYTYSYIAFGELVAWITGWALILEYGMAASAVASGWSSYFQGLLNGFGLYLPTALTSGYNLEKGTFIDVPAIVIILTLTFLLSKGVRELTRVNSTMVIIKVGAVLLFIAVGVWYVQPDNWAPFMPFGFSGVAAGAATVFFAYLGFDVVSTAAEEVKNPQKNMPIGIIASLLICTALYMIVTLVLTGIVPYTELNVKNPVAFALNYIHQDWVAGFISLGAITGMTTVLMGMIYAQTRLFFAMSRDGLFPKVLNKVNAKSDTPVVTTWVTGILVAIFGGVIPLNKLAEMVSMGTLGAYIIVSLGVLSLRKTNPDLSRPFKVPFLPVITILTVLSCGYLILNLSAVTWIACGAWFLIGLIIYLVFGRKNSNMANQPLEEPTTLS